MILGVDQQLDASRLLERCRRGDEVAWTKLVNRYSDLVYSVPSRMKLNSEDCSDVFQATFLALSSGLDRIESAVALPRWLAVVASREALRLRRSSGRTTNASAYDHLDLDALVADEEKSAETMAIEALDADSLHEGIAKLQPRCRSLIQLLFVEPDISYSEISVRTGQPVGGIGPTRARCLDKLREILAKSGFFDD